MPLYPVPGNHENDAQYFFDYFHLPERYARIFRTLVAHGLAMRVIGLDSNRNYRIDVQLNGWTAF